MDLNKAKKGQEHVKSKSGGGKNFTPLIYWKEDKETRYLAFLTPVDEIVTVDVHTFQTANGWRTFICREDDVFADEGGYCPLCSEHNDTAARRHLAIAAELETVKQRVGGRQKITDVKVKMIEVERDGKTKEYPRIGLVMQSASNFFNYLTAYDAQRADITSVSFEIQRQGKGSGTTYSFFDVDMRPDLDSFEEDLPSVLDFLAEKGSLEHYQAELGSTIAEGIGVRLTDTTSAQESDPAVEETPVADGGLDEFDKLRARLEERTAS